MALLDRCVFNPTSAGTGDFIVSAAVTGFQTPAQAGAQDGVTYSYAAESANKTQWEVGRGVYTVSSATLARTTIEFSSNAGSKVNFSSAPKVFVTALAADFRTQLTANTTYYVNANTGSDTTGNGSVGTPWATIQHAVNYVMYNVTGQGVYVTIQVSDGTYHENVSLGPHQIFGLAGDYDATARINFSSVATPGNVVIAPTSQGPTWSGTYGATLSCQNSTWHLTGGFSITQGASGNISGIAAFNKGELYLGGSDFIGTNTSVLFNDAVDDAFEADFDSVIICGDQRVNIEFTSTVGTLATVDARSHIEFYEKTHITFNIDPGFNGSQPGGALSGMWGADYSGGCTITSRAIYAGSSAASPTPSGIDFGNEVIDVNDYMGLANITLKSYGARYNGIFKEIGIGTIPTNPVHISHEGSVAGLKIENAVDVLNGAGIEYKHTFGSTDWFNGLANSNFYFYDIVNDIQPLVLSNNGTDSLITTSALGILGWSDNNKYAAGIIPSSGVGPAVVDTGLSRIGAKVVAVGNGTQGDATGALALSLVKLQTFSNGSPADGDYWYDGTHLYFRDGGSSVDLLAAGSFGSLTVGSTAITSGSAGQILFDSGGTLQEDANLVWDNTNKQLNLVSATTVEFTCDGAPGGSGNTAGFSLKNTAAGGWEIHFQTRPGLGWFEITDSSGIVQHAWEDINYWQPATGVHGWNSSRDLNSSFAIDTGLSRLGPGVVAVGNGNTGNKAGTLDLTSIILEPTAIASLPGSPVAGQVAAVNDALVPVIGSPVASGGAAFAAVCWNGSAWNVFVV